MRVLLLLEQAMLEELAAAAEPAMGLGITDADPIHTVLEHKLESLDALCYLDSRPSLQFVHVLPTDIAASGWRLDSGAPPRARCRSTAPVRHHLTSLE